MLIELNDLRHSINRALNLGRYQIVVKTAGAEQVPASITLDLLERDDDGFAFPTDTTNDDHGAAIPSQDFKAGAFALPESPRVYEFTIQSLNKAAAKCGAGPFTLDSPDLLTEAFTWMECDRGMTADWVHVYDRVTRERRTLKRPEPDAVLTGLRDVASDLRCKADVTALGEAITEVASGAAERRSSPGKWRVYRDGEKVVYETFDQPPAAEPMPPVGPLTSTYGLKAGDIIRSETDEFAWRPRGSLLRVTSTTPGSVSYSVIGSTDAGSCNPETFAFVARPGVWMPWEGGENPVPGLWVKTKSPHNLYEGDADASEEYNWSAWFGHPIGFYMVVDTPPASSET